MINSILYKKCIVCKREYPYRAYRTNRRSINIIRSANTITCSKPCSRVYSRISEYIRSNFKSYIKKLELRLDKLEVMGK
jgi:hypothetical protein